MCIVGNDDRIRTDDSSDNKMLINLKNDGDKGADGVINIYGYDDSGNIVYLYSMTKYVDKKDTFEELFDLPVGEDGQKIIPVRYETEVMSFIQDY